MTTPTRFPNGVSTMPVGKPLADFPFPDPFHTSGNAKVGSVQYINDFDTLIGTDYTVTGVSSTFALANTVVGGAGLLTPGGATTASSAYKAGQFAGFISGQKFWFLTRFQVSALAGTEYVGLQAGASVNDGIWFAINASGAISLVSTVGAAATTLVASTAFTAAAGATWIDLGFYYNGTDIIVYQGDVMVARVAAPTIGASGTTLTNAILGPVFQITPTATQTMLVDYVITACEVVR